MSNIYRIRIATHHRGHNIEIEGDNAEAVKIQLNMAKDAIDERLAWEKDNG